MGLMDLVGLGVMVVRKRGHLLGGADPSMEHGPHVYVWTVEALTRNHSCKGPRDISIPNFLLVRGVIDQGDVVVAGL